MSIYFGQLVELNADLNKPMVGCVLSAREKMVRVQLNDYQVEIRVEWLKVAPWCAEEDDIVIL